MKYWKYVATLVTLSTLAGATSCNLEGKYTVGGTLAGLLGSGLVLANNGGNDLSFTANGSFVFSSSVRNGDAYSVTVVTQPSNPAQICTVHNSSGTINKANIINVLVTCTQAGRFAYVANQTDNDVSAYAVDSASGVLTPIAGSPFASSGTGPVGVAVDPNQMYLYVLNNGSNSVSTYTVDYSTGILTALGVAVSTGIQPTGIAVAPGGQFLYVANSGDNTVSAYTLSGGVATPVVGSPYLVGNTPFALKVDPNGNFLYVTNFADGTVSAFAIDQSTGELYVVAGSPFGAGAGAVALAIDPTNTYAYVANETAATISAYSLNPTTGALVPLSDSPLATGSSPESVAVSPGGSVLYAANVTAKNEVAPYSITPSSGELTLGTPGAAGTLPLGVAVDPAGTFVYAANDGSNDVSVYSVDAATGALTAVAGSPFLAGAGARAIAIY